MNPKYTKELLEDTVKDCRSYAEVLVKLGRKQAGGNITHLKNRLNTFDINVDHFVGQGWNKGGIALNKKCYTDILVERSSGARCKTNQLKRALIESGVDYICSICGINCNWNGSPLVLQVDHIDGNWLDDRRENVRFLCPNCHSQTPTFSRSKSDIQSNTCYDCGTNISKSAKLCRSCSAKNVKRKVDNRPTYDMLVVDVTEFGYSATGRKYGVSDTTIRKWLQM